MSEEIISGSCLCGTVKYGVKKPYLRFAHCYCTRCRKATGSSHATNLYVEPSSFNWIAGESSIKRFDLLTAESFATTFCIDCGGPLPHHTRSGREIVIPAGSLDDDPAINPQSHIFWDSRAKWSCGGEDLPKFKEYTDNWRRSTRLTRPSSIASKLAGPRFARPLTAGVIRHKRVTDDPR